MSFMSAWNSALPFVRMNSIYVFYQNGSHRGTVHILHSMSEMGFILENIKSMFRWLDTLKKFYLSF